MNRLIPCFLLAMAPYAHASLNPFESTAFFGFIDPAVDVTARANVRFIKPASLFQAKGLVREVYSRCQHDFAPAAEPFLIQSPSPEVLMGFWLISYESFLPVRVPRYLKEAAAVTVSSITGTPYCEQAHRAVGISTLPGAAMTRAFRSGSFLPPGAAQLPEPAARNAGWLWSVSHGEALRVSLPDDEAAEIAGVALVFHYVNRLINTFVRHPAFRVTGKTGMIDKLFFTTATFRVGKLARQSRPPFAAIALAQREGFRARGLSLPGSLGTGRIAQAFATWSDVMESVRARLARSTHVSGAELDAIERAIRDDAPPAMDTPAVRFAMLVAREPAKVTTTPVGGDRFIVELAAWASYLATMRIARNMP